MDQEILRHIAHHLALLKKVFKVDSIYVAGGCLRDLEHDKPINDIDVFIPATGALAVQCKLARKPSTRPLTYVGDLYNLYRKQPKSLSQKYGQQWPTGLIIHGIEEIEHKPYNIQVILYDHVGRKGPQILLKYFDIGLCQISYDGDRMHRSAAYKKDRDEKTITAFNTNARTTERVQKLVEKYGFTSALETRSRVEEEPVIDWDHLLRMTGSTPGRYQWNVTSSS